MSSKLVLEFYEDFFHSEPVEVLLVFHGGEEPEAAALTVSDFLTQIRALAGSSQHSARDLATRFILWQQSIEGELDGRCPAAILIEPRASYGYQLARIYADKSGPSVDIVGDEYSTTQEMQGAQEILSISGIKRSGSGAPKTAVI